MVKRTSIPRRGKIAELIRGGYLPSNVAAGERSFRREKTLSGPYSVAHQTIGFVRRLSASTRARNSLGPFPSGV